MEFVAGIDQSVRHTGVCVLDRDGNTAALQLIEPSRKLKNEEKLAYIRRELNSILSQFSLKRVVMEGYSYNSANKKFLLGEVGAVVKLVVYDQNTVLYEAAPKQLKKFVTSNGSADKDQVIRCIYKQWNIHIDDDNLADAYGLAWIAHEIVWPASKKRHQLDVVKKILNSDLKKPKKAAIKSLPFAL